MMQLLILLGESLCYFSRACYAHPRLARGLLHSSRWANSH